MEPSTRNFTVVEGDTFEATITFLDASTGNPLNLSGATFNMHVRTSYDAAATSLELASGAGITLDALNGKITLSKAVAISAGEYVYDIQASFSGPIVRTYLRGRFKVLDGVTV